MRFVILGTRSPQSGLQVDKKAKWNFKKAKQVNRKLAKEKAKSAKRKLQLPTAECISDLEQSARNNRQPKLIAPVIPTYGSVPSAVWFMEILRTLELSEDWLSCRSGKK